MRKQYTATIKAKIVSELLQEEKTLTQLSSEYGVSSKQLIRWKNHVLTEMPRLFERKSERSQEKYDNKINELYGEIGRLSTQVNWLKKKSGLNLEPDTIEPPTDCVGRKLFCDAPTVDATHNRRFGFVDLPAASARLVQGTRKRVCTTVVKIKTST